MQKRYLVILAIAACAVAVLAQSDDPAIVRVNTDSTRSQPESNPVRLVEVVNFPNPQNVAGTVAVDNFPAEQVVTGTVHVGSG